MSLLQLGHALFQPGNARLEFRFVDDAFGIAVDEPADPAPQAGYLTIEVKYLVWRSGAIARLSDAPTVFMGYAIGCSRRAFTWSQTTCSSWSLRTGPLSHTAAPLNR